MFVHFSFADVMVFNLQFRKSSQRPLVGDAVEGGAEEEEGMERGSMWRSLKSPRLT